jgi:hypothetical protein
MDLYSDSAEHEWTSNGKQKNNKKKEIKEIK